MIVSPGARCSPKSSYSTVALRPSGRWLDCKGECHRSGDTVPGAHDRRLRTAARRSPHPGSQRMPSQRIPGLAAAERGQHSCARVSGSRKGIHWPVRGSCCARLPPMPPTDAFPRNITDHDTRFPAGNGKEIKKVAADLLFRVCRNVNRGSRIPFADVGSRGAAIAATR